MALKESFAWGTDLAVDSVKLDDSSFWCDHDGTVDPGETGLLSVHIKNVGGLPLKATTVSAQATVVHVTTATLVMIFACFICISFP